MSALQRKFPPEQWFYVVLLDMLPNGGQWFILSCLCMKLKRVTFQIKAHKLYLHVLFGNVLMYVCGTIYRVLYTIGVIRIFHSVDKALKRKLLSNNFIRHFLVYFVSFPKLKAYKLPFIFIIFFNKVVKFHSDISWI